MNFIIDIFFGTLIAYIFKRIFDKFCGHYKAFNHGYYEQNASFKIWIYQILTWLMILTLVRVYLGVVNV